MVPPLVIKFKRCFSLIEVLIAMSLLIILLGVVGINVRSALKTQNFESSADLFLNQLRMAQDRLVVFNIETEVNVSLKDSQVIPIGTLNEVYERLISKDKIKLNAFQSITYQDLVNPSLKEGSFNLEFKDSGFMMPKGIITLTLDEETKNYIYLPGFPSPFKLLKSEPNQNDLDQQERLFYERLTLSTLSQLKNSESKL